MRGLSGLARLKLANDHETAAITFGMPVGHRECLTVYRTQADSSTTPAILNSR